MLGQGRRGDLGVGDAGSIHGAKPAVVRPHHRLNRGFAAQRTAAAIANGPAAEMHHVGLSLRSLHQVGVPGALQFDIRPVACRQYIYVRVQFVRAGELARARHGDRMSPSCAAFGGQQVVIAVALVEMGPLGKSQRRTLEDQVDRPHQPARRRGEYSCNTIPEKRLPPGRWSQRILTQILAAVVVVEQRRIEAAAVEVNRIGPLAVDPRAGHEVIVCVTQRCARGAALSRSAISLHVRIDEPEEAVGVAEAGGPNAAGIRIAQHIQLAGAIQGAREQAPVNQVAGMVDLHSRIPLESGCGDVVVVSDTDDGGIRIKSGQNRVSNAGGVIRHPWTAPFPVPVRGRRWWRGVRGRLSTRPPPPAGQEDRGR